MSAEEAAEAQKAMERRLIGWVVASGDIPIVARDLKPDMFQAAEHVTAWEILLDLAEDDTTITPDAIIHVARQRGELPRLPGGSNWPFEVAKEACLPQVVTQNVEMILAYAAKRNINRAAANCQAQIEIGAPLSEVLEDLETATTQARSIEAGGWPAPLPLVAQVPPEPFPIDAFPSGIQAAIREVQAFVQAPMPMVAMSALGAVSVAGQGLVDVKRAEGLQGPSGLFLMCIAPSGERKTTCDRFFTDSIRAYELGAQEERQPLVLDYNAEHAAWDAKRRGLLGKIETQSKAGRSARQQEAELQRLSHEEPVAPRVPKLLYADSTPEALAWSLAKNWPSAAIMSSEAGSILGAHGMGRDSIMRNLALLNQLWDGVPVRFDRRTSEGFLLHGARLTISLQVQEETLREFLRTDDGLARGMGFLARILLAYPESTQGDRFFRDPPSGWPALTRFKNCLAEVLNIPVSIGDDGALLPVMLPLSSEARKAWVEFHDAIEKELPSGGKFADVRDVASKTADNAARLAALFHVFQHGAKGEIGTAALQAGTRIAAWHLHEARRFLGEFAMPRELADAAQLASWLAVYCRRHQTNAVPVSAIQKGGPGRLRGKAAMEAAVQQLADLDRARMVKHGRAKTVEVNPALVATAVPAVSAALSGCSPCPPQPATTAGTARN
jgi:putative DNA primase/helicase